MSYQMLQYYPFYYFYNYFWNLKNYK